LNKPGVFRACIFITVCHSSSENGRFFDWRKSSENCYSARQMAHCVVSYLDREGLRHSVEVDAESLFEAAALAIRTFKQHDCAPAEMTKLEVEIRSSVVHETTVKRVREWLSGGARSPKEAVTKERLRAML
jgi:hypothetical protein